MPEKNNYVTPERAAQELEAVAGICTSTTLSVAAAMGAAALRGKELPAGMLPTSVDKGMPPENEEILVFVASGQYKRSYFERTWLFGQWNRNGGWILSDYPTAEEFTITHWMDLPGDPTETPA